MRHLSAPQNAKWVFQNTHSEKQGIMSQKHPITTFNCRKGCCTIRINLSHQRTHRSYSNTKRREKAGVFVLDPGFPSPRDPFTGRKPSEPKVLLVQSRGRLWGPPKGTFEEGETSVQCALREVKEETGLNLNPTLFTKKTRVKSIATYFYLEMDECKVSPDTEMEDNDVNGITWIRLGCLGPCIEDGHIVLNKHCRILLKRFLNLSFPTSEFVRVKSKRWKRRDSYYPGTGVNGEYLVESDRVQDITSEFSSVLHSQSTNEESRTPSVPAEHSH